MACACEFELLHAGGEIPGRLHPASTQLVGTLYHLYGIIIRLCNIIANCIVVFFSCLLILFVWLSVAYTAFSFCF